MIVTILQLALLTGMLCNGLKIITGQRMLFQFVRDYLDKLFTKEANGELKVSKVYYPILFCIKCMPSVYGTILSLVFLPFSINLLWQIPIICIPASFISTALSQLYDE